MLGAAPIHGASAIRQDDDLSRDGTAGSREPSRGWGRENGTLELLGAPKSGFKLSADVSPTSIGTHQPDGPRVALPRGWCGGAARLDRAALAAPARVVLEAGLFAALFSPIALFLVISALRLQATCSIDLAGDRVQLLERRYVGCWQRIYRLEDVGSVLRCRPLRRASWAPSAISCSAWRCLTELTCWARVPPRKPWRHLAVSWRSTSAFHSSVTRTPPSSRPVGAGS